MWNPFRKKPLLQEEDELFQIECYRWLLTHFGGVHFYKETQLVLPTKDFFPLNPDSQESIVQSLFDQVKKFTGLNEWPCKLEMQDEDPKMRVAPTVLLQNAPRGPLGTFSADVQNEIVITFNPNIASDPYQLVATFAHELSHYLTGTSPEPPPGGWDNWEFATDICAAFLGFGIFTANAAFNFQQVADVESQGWETTGCGYLSEAEYSYSLALFLLLKEIPPESAYPHCDPNIKAYLRTAIIELRSSNKFEELRLVEHVPQHS